MEIIDFLTLFTGISLGSFLGILGNKIINQEENSNWKWAFYIYGCLGLIISIVIFISKIEILGVNIFTVILICSITTNILILISTYCILDKKFTYKIPQLDPIINKFTSKADKNEIKLFGGDLSFLGNSPSEISKNVQYIHLRSLEFRNILILCELPVNQIQKMRYGQILTELPQCKIRFYNPDQADLRVRGRIIKMDGANKLLVYTKVNEGIYKAIEDDTGNSNGALYNNIWNLVWSLANKPSPDEINSYKFLFQGE